MDALSSALMPVSGSTVRSAHARDWLASFKRHVTASSAAVVSSVGPNILQCLAQFLPMAFACNLVRASIHDARRGVVVDFCDGSQSGAKLDVARSPDRRVARVWAAPVTRKCASASLFGTNRSRASASASSPEPVHVVCSRAVAWLLCDARMDEVLDSQSCDFHQWLCPDDRSGTRQGASCY